MVGSRESVPFDRIAGRYDQTRGGLKRGTRFAAALDRQLQPRSRVLEIAVGTGVVARPLDGLGHEVVGIDLSSAMLAIAASRIGRLVQGDATRLPFRAGCVDAVVGVWAVHVIGDFEALVQEVRRVLGPSGPVSGGVVDTGCRLQ